jgi:hypothetical protein
MMARVVHGGQLESDTCMKSSEKRGHQILGIMSEKRASAFLLDCVNLHSDPATREAEFRRLRTLYADIVPDPVPSILDRDVALAFRYLSFLLRRGWDAPTQREREWYFREGESFGRHLTAKDAEKVEWDNSHMMYCFVKPPAQPTPLEAVFHYLWRNVKHALHCANPECSVPYFFATKKSQKFCSAVCAEPARRESKLRWCNKNRAGKPKTKRGKQTKTTKASRELHKNHPQLKNQKGT